MSTAAVKTRKILTIDVKLQILADVDTKTLPKKYEIPHNRLSIIIKNRTKIETSSLEPQRKKPRLATNATVDEAVLTWFKQTRAINAPTSGPIIREQARLIAERLGVTDFEASSRWLMKFKQRHGIVFKVACGESASVDTSIIDEWKTTLSSLMKEYSPRDVFNSDETGLFFRCFPNKTHTFKGEDYHGAKQAKDRLTVLIATNSRSIEKLPLLVIGKLSNPRCFKNVKSLPVEYVSNSKAWMTSSIFETWIHKLDRKYILLGHSIVMAIDNCSAHPKIEGLKAIRLEFLPPITTSHTQTCEQDIINAFKHRFRSMVVRPYLQHVDGDSASGFHVSILDALYNMRCAWGMVTPETITNCFKKTGFCAEEDSTQRAPNADSAFEELSALFNRIDNANAVVEEYVNIDSALAVTGDISVDSIVDSIKERQEPPEDDDDDEDEAVPLVAGSDSN